MEFKEDKYLNYIVDKKNFGVSLKDFLLHKNISRHFLIKLRNSDQVLVDGALQKFWLPLRENQIVSLNPFLKVQSQVNPEAMDIDIVYEDEDFIAVDKPYNMATHPTGLHLNNTIANGVINYLLKKQVFTLHPINRLDKTTSGIIIFGKHPLAQHHIFQQKIKKEYVALVEGLVHEEEMLLNFPIKRLDGPSIKRIVATDGKKALTKINLISREDKYSLLRIRLFTGRTHQIRVHLSHIGHPLVGDFLYGEENAPRLFLHSHRYTFLPLRNKKEIEIVSPVPQIFFDYK